MKPRTKRILFTLLKALGVLGISFALLLLYEFAVRVVLEAVFWVYFALLALSSVFVVIYNFGFSRRFIRREELPNAWTEAQKDAFFAEAATRWRHTKPIVLYLILPLCLCFAFDILCLFLWGPLVDLFPLLA